MPWVTIHAVDPLDVLVGRLSDGAVTTDTDVLRDRAVDSWSLALLRRSRGDDLPVPAAVVFPARTEEVATVLAGADQARVAVIPRRSARWSSSPTRGRAGARSGRTSRRSSAS